MKANEIGRKTIRFSNSTINLILVTIIILLAAYAGYALWDSNQIYDAADRSNYAVYKPTAADGGKSFKELQAINDEVFAWLTVYGTSIDYPVTQGPDNMRYVNTNAEGQYSLSGAIFLDWGNSNDFSDFNSILYGHHMARRVMFGEIGEFSDRNKFDAHRFGNLYFNGRDHGIEFFAFVHADAYDTDVFTANVGDDSRQAYLDGLLEKAKYTRDIGVSINDRIVLLSTCSSDSTNGRDILVGRITDKTHEGFDFEMESNVGYANPNLSGLDCYVDEIPLLLLLLIFTLTALLVVRIYKISHRRKRSDNLGDNLSDNLSDANIDAHSDNLGDSLGDNLGDANIDAHSDNLNDNLNSDANNDNLNDNLNNDANCDTHTDSQ
ncbi:MAG: class B sortase [Synergistaceae bacterium]|nr:class B sortase [Synergistaceae bacterium]